MLTAPVARVGLPCALCLATVALSNLLFAQQTAGDAESPRNPATVQELPQVFVIGNAPLPGFGLPLREVPANVQTADSRDLKNQQTLDIADYLNNNFSGVNVSESQGNPLQADVNYHGFTASPLIGTPQGLSVYVDSVRVNESFGDTVNWDLIPEAAISTITLMPGSNPVFGLNTLGGALSVQTKNGHDNPGTELEGYAGSFGRTELTALTGGSRGGFDWFLAGNDLDEHGWRDLSPTHARQLFGKAGWQNEHTDLDLSYSWADNSMTGNGTTPQSLLDHRYNAIYSAPDHTHNHLNFVNLVGTQSLNERWLLSGNVYYRELQTDSNNGDVNDNNYLTNDYVGPPIDCTAPLTTHVANAYCSNGINRSSALAQKTAGFGLQLTSAAERFGGRNQLILGTEYSHARDDYEQRLAYATMSADRTAVMNDNPANPNQIVNSLTGTNAIWGAYFTDTWSPNDVLHVSVSARYNDSHETLGGYSVDTDVGNFGSGFDSTRPLTGNHSFSRLNPAIGFTLTPNRNANVFANYSESSRAPTVVELGCSDPNTPCGLPNDFAGDPDLQQVVSKTFELGARGALAGMTVNWSADLFHTINYHDIQFVATTTSTGYFNNVGTTRRQGLDLSLGGKLLGWAWHVAYSLIDATYQSSFLVNGESNSSADANGDILVAAGARIPLIPRHTGRLVIDYNANPDWDVGGALVMSSGSFLHGNENNENVAGGTNAGGGTVVGTGMIGSYAVVNLFGTVHVARMVEIFARVNNVLDRKYATTGFLTSNAFAPNGSFRADPNDWTNENSVSPAAPLAAWIGIRLHWE
jgi:outer membrane receptor protein involved in Fe transport